MVHPKCKLGAEETSILVSDISGGGGGRTARAKGNMKVLQVHQVRQGIDQNEVLLTLDPQAQKIHLQSRVNS